MIFVSMLLTVCCVVDSYKLRQNPYLPVHPNYGLYAYPQQNHKQPTRESIMEILYSVAQNDDLQCVPKLICEIAGGTVSARQYGFNLPVNINMNSLLGLMSNIVTSNSSPVLHFGKALLLGLTSMKNNKNTCEESYSRCPSDPDKLMFYLNNHNGGFFRYFNGHNYQKRQSPSYAQKRIQNAKSERYNFIFPNHDVTVFDKGYEFTRGSKSIFIFPNNFPDYKTTEILFPDRTGTGELRFDDDSINHEYEQSLHNDNRYFNPISFPQ